jgi:putative aminopeptidase FrvX
MTSGPRVVNLLLPAIASFEKPCPPSHPVRNRMDKWLDCGNGRGTIVTRSIPGECEANMKIEEYLSNTVGAPYLDEGWLAEVVCQLSASLSPSGSALLAGGIMDTVVKTAGGMGLSSHLLRNYRSTFNGGLQLGAPGDPDLIICAHLDKPGYGVSTIESSDEALLYPVSAIRMKEGITELEAVGTRYDLKKGKMVCASRGRLICTRRADVEDVFRYLVDDGDLRLEDQVTMVASPVRDGELLTVNSLDDSAGVAVTLAAAALLLPLEEALVEADLTLLCCFTDNEEWPAQSNNFAMGAMRLGHAIPPPSIGSIVMDTQAVGNIRSGGGISYGYVSAGGLGAPVSLDCRAILDSLKERLNAVYPNTAQFNRGYFSRSDEFGFVRWSRAVGLFGVPVDNIHRGPETCNVRDLVASVRFLGAYCALLLGVLE